MCYRTIVYSVFTPALHKPPQLSAQMIKGDVHSLFESSNSLFMRSFKLSIYSLYLIKCEFSFADRSSEAQFKVLSYTYSIEETFRL